MEDRLDSELKIKLSWVCPQGFVLGKDGRFYRGSRKGRLPLCEACDFPGCEFL
jgi:hypothetical protein